MAKNIYLAYVVWLFFGWLGLHHFYLGRERQGLVWYFTLGGFGIGWLRDLCRIPDYIAEANEDEDYMHLLRAKSSIYPQPSFSMTRFALELLVGWLLGFLFLAAIPEDIEICQILKMLLPVVVAVGVHLVGNIGHESVSFKTTLIGSCGAFAACFLNSTSFTYVALSSAIYANTGKKSWRIAPRRQHWCYRLVVVSVCCLLYTSLWASTIYHNTYIISADGQKVKVKVALKNFFNSPAWAETKKTASTLWNHFKEFGFHKLYEELVYSIDPEGEVHAYKVLGVNSHSSEKEITAAYRSLARQWHPDKHSDPGEKENAAKKFMEIQQAYETLSTIQTRRTKRNKRQRPRWADDL